ncbi:MAG: GIY-YIG nuclease family protein [Pyrinomonadaceae bacterium]
MMDRKEAKRDYKLNPQSMGVFQIRSAANEKVFVGSSTNLDGIFNRHRFALDADSHQNKSLQAD